MANFLLYKYKFSEASGQSLFAAVGGELLTEEKLSKMIDDTLFRAFHNKQH